MSEQPSLTTVLPQTAAAGQWQWFGSHHELYAYGTVQLKVKIKCLLFLCPGFLPLQAGRVNFTCCSSRTSVLSHPPKVCSPKSCASHTDKVNRSPNLLLVIHSTNTQLKQYKKSCIGNVSSSGSNTYTFIQGKQHIL